jgi:hypothetical protein
VRSSLFSSTLLLLCVASEAGAQTHPLLTEEAATAPGGTITLETGFDWMAAEPNFLTGAERSVWAGPLARVVYSPSDNVEIDLEWVSTVGSVNDPDFGNATDRGDVTLRAKVRFVDGGARRPTVGARFWVSLPETRSEEGLGPNALRQAAEMLLSQPLGRATLLANAGLLIADEVLRPHEQRDFLSYGVALTNPVGGHGEVVGEVAGRLGKGQPGAEERGEIRAGFRWTHGRVRYDAAIRRGLAPADGTWGFTAGLRWTIRDGTKKPATVEPVP